MSTIEELDVIRLTVPMEGADVFDKARVIPLPVGSEGTVVHVFGAGAAFETEFLVFDNPADPEDYTSVQIAVEAAQCELSWRCPA